MPAWYWALVGAGLALPIGVGYVISLHTVGRKVARQRVVILLLTVLVTGFLFVPLLLAPRTWRDNGMAIFSFGFTGYVVWYAWFTWYQRRQAGAVLLDLGYSQRGRQFALGMALLVFGLAVFSLINNVTYDGFTLKNLAQFAWYTSISIFYLITTMNRNQIRQHGLLVGGSLLRWENLRRYRWQRGSPDRLNLRGNGLWHWFGATMLPIPPEYHTRVDELLAQYTNATPHIQQ